MSTSPASTMYTLPGVMHYLQTEFTRNERDRIGWELERSEMKTRIAQLEGENRSLRYELAKISDLENSAGENPDDASIQEPLLLKSKLAVQENVKEIVYLLRSPNVTEQLHGLRDPKDAVHDLEAMNLNSKTQPALSQQGLQQTNLSSHNNRNLQQDLGELHLRKAPVASFTPELSPKVQPLETNIEVPLEAASDHGSEVNTIIADELPSAGRSRASSLFASSSSNPSPNKVLRCKRLRYHLAGIEKLVVSQYNMLSYARDGLMKHWMIEPNLNCNDKLTKSFHGLAPIVLSLHWLDNQSFLTVDNFGLKVWQITESAPCFALDAFDDESAVSFPDIQSVDFKNKWLVLTCNNVIHIWEVIVDSKSIDIGSKHKLEDSGRILDSILGMTEKSLIVLKREPYKLVIYSFQGELLQSISLQEEINKFKGTKEEIDESTCKLLLNKQSSKLMVQLGQFVAVYSFDRKKIIVAKQFEMVPRSIIFRSSIDYAVFAFDDGTVEVRNINKFQTILKTYNHYDDETEYEDESSSRICETIKGDEDKALSEMRQNAHKGIVVDVAEIDLTTVIISGGDDGMIRFERAVECV
ncbi:LANO_0H12904g1_1 [Lachancea nothofagi CBS 11611]|uniref:LANO_0H12904g1_1 n=1 Tax=Lachancea nothofagi CBS 11611 TaxID=1266666 RepID=A0A1G4KM87_9SACH|nr:LANO_0H12904g1_1 [Lachancea nothofagi CBS 11611]